MSNSAQLLCRRGVDNYSVVEVIIQEKSLYL